MVGSVSSLWKRGLFSFYFGWREKQVAIFKPERALSSETVGNGCLLFKPYVIGGIVIHFVYCPVLRYTHRFHRMGFSPTRNH